METSLKRNFVGEYGRGDWLYSLKKKVFRRKLITHIGGGVVKKGEILLIIMNYVHHFLTWPSQLSSSQLQYH